MEITRDNYGAATAFTKLQEQNLAVPRPGLLYRVVAIESSADRRTHLFLQPIPPAEVRTTAEIWRPLQGKPIYSGPRNTGNGPYNTFSSQNPIPPSICQGNVFVDFKSLPFASS